MLFTIGFIIWIIGGFLSYHVKNEAAKDFLEFVSGAGGITFLASIVYKLLSMAWMYMP